MRTLFLTLIISTLLFISCKQEKQPPIPPEKIRIVLQEMLIAQQGYELSGLEATVKEQKIAAAYTQILKNAQIPKDQFEAALTYYYAHPELLEQIYTKMTEELQILQSQQ
ncbi:MAG: DUF4296 domain-containing protein [Bacteroidia bacterium]|nr:DUF4296 domain-containing protein [Bacteroidia bacterium]